jgi:hypothetical protein
MPVDANAENTHGRLVVLHDHRHRRRYHVGGIGTEDQVDFVDGDELGVDAGHIRRVALVVIIDKLDRPPEQPALGVDVVAPKAKCNQKLLAVLRHAAGHGHAEADLDRLTGGSRRLRAKQQRSCYARRHD